jgi:lysophospholipase L1-like esterase
VADRVDGAIEHGARRLGDGIGAVLSWVVLVTLVWPVHLLSRLVGYSPLTSGRSAPGSRWVPVGAERTRSPDGAPLRPDSMAAPELRPSHAVRRRSRLRLLPVFAVGLVVLVAVWPWTVDWPWSDGGETVAGDAGTFTRSFEDDPAFADAPWAANVRLSLLDAWNNLEFNAAEGGWSIRDIASDHVNVTGGERLTVAPDPGLGDPVVVWLVGASAAFGAGQRDDHTIASELVRRAGRDGIPLQVRNLAVPATVNWQTATQLTSRLLWDVPPDLIVVYDGANDLSLQESLASRGLGDSDRPASLVDEEFDRILRERAAAGGAGAALPEPVETSVAGPVPTGDELAARVVTRYGRGLELIRRSAPATDADRETLRAVGLDESSVERWRALADGVRRELPALGVVDLSSVYDGRSEPIYWDTVHTNEVGSLLAADAIYAGILPEVAAARSRSGG